MHHNHQQGQQIKVQNWVYPSNELSQPQHQASQIANQQITQQQEQQQYTQHHPFQQQQQQQVSQPQNNAISRSWDFKDSNSNRSQDIKIQLPLLKKLLHMGGSDMQQKIYAEQNSVQNCSSAQNIRSDDENFKTNTNRSQNNSESYQQYERNMKKHQYSSNQVQDSEKEQQWASNKDYQRQQVPIRQEHQQFERNYENDEQRILGQEYYQEEEDEEEVIDFKEQIERNYDRSVANKIYSFPRQIDSDWSGFESDQTNSLTNSVLLYDLHQQNVSHHQNSSQQHQQTNTNNSNNHQHSQTLQSLQDYIQDTIHNLIVNHMPTKQTASIQLQQHNQQQQQQQYFSQRQQNIQNPSQPQDQQQKQLSSEGQQGIPNISLKPLQTQIPNQVPIVDPQLFKNNQKNNQIIAQIDSSHKMDHLAQQNDQNQSKQLSQGNYQNKKDAQKRLKTEGYTDFVEDEGVIQSIGLFAEKEDDSELSEDVARIPDKQYEYLVKDQVNILEKCVSTDEKTSQSVRTSTIKGNSSNKSSVVHQSLKDTVINSNNINNIQKLWIPPTSNNGNMNNNGNQQRSNHKNMNNATMSILTGKQQIGNDLSHKRLQIGMGNKSLNKSVPLQQSNVFSQQIQVVQSSQQGTSIGNLSDHQQAKSKKRKVNLLESMLMDTMKIQNKTENQAEMKVTLQPRLINNINNNNNNIKSREGGGVSTSLNFNSISEMILSREEQQNHSSQTTKKIFQTSSTTSNLPPQVNSQIIPSTAGGVSITIANKRCETPSQQISSKYKDNSALKTQKSRDINNSTTKQTNRQIKPSQQQQQQQQSLLRNTRLKTENSHPSSSAMGNYTVISERHGKSRERISSGSKPKRANNNSATLLTAETNSTKGIQKSLMPCAAEKFKKESAKITKLLAVKKPQIQQNLLNGNTQPCNIVQNSINIHQTNNGSGSKNNNFNLRPPVPSQHNYNSNHQLLQKPQQSSSQVSQLLDGYQQQYHKSSLQQQQQQHHLGSASPDILIKQYLSENAKEQIDQLNYKRFHTEDDNQSSNVVVQKSLEKKKYEQEIMKAHLLRQLALKYVQKIPLKQHPQQSQQQQQFLKKIDSSQAPLQDIRSSYSSETIWMDRNLANNQRAFTEPSCVEEQLISKTAKTNAIISKAKPKLSALLLRDLPLPSKKEIPCNNSNVSYSNRNKSSVRMRGQQEQGRIKVENHNISKSSSRDNSRNRSQLQNALLQQQQQQFQLK